MKEKVIVSLTSWSKRIEKLSIIECLNSICNQTYKPDKIILYLDIDEFPNKNEDLPSYILEFSDRIEIKFCEKNLLSHDKWYWVFKEYPNDLIILLDDDIVHEENLVETLIYFHEKYQDSIISNRSHKMVVNKILNYNNFIKYENIVHGDEIISNNLFLTTGFGTLIKPSMFDDEIYDLDKITTDFKNVDDIWINYHIYRLNLQVVCVNRLSSLNLVDELNEPSISLYTKNVCFGNNMKVLNIPYVNAMFKKRAATDEINIVYITDSNYADLTYYSLKSLILKSNPFFMYNIYIIGVNLKEFESDKFKRLSSKHININVINDDLEAFIPKTLIDKERTDVNRHISKAAFCKFIIPNIIDKKKVLYLDSDTLIHKDISIFYQNDINDYFAAATIDGIYAKAWNINFYKLSNSDSITSKCIKNYGFYFNSGVMLLNLELMRKYNISRKLIDFKLENDTELVDQDTFNSILGGKVKELPLYYNVFYSYRNISKKILKFTDKDKVVEHIAQNLDSEKKKLIIKDFLDKKG